jgi:hypothetical protein
LCNNGNALKYGKLCRDTRCGTIPNKHSMVWEENIHPHSPFPFRKRRATYHSIINSRAWLIEAKQDAKIPKQQRR